MNKLKKILNSIGYSDPQQVQRDLLYLQSEEGKPKHKRPPSKIKSKYIPPSSGLGHSHVSIGFDLDSYENSQFDHENYKSKLFD